MFLDDESGEEARIEEEYVRLYEGMVKKDRTVLSEVLAPSFELMHMTGMKQSKDEFIEAVMDGTLNYYSAGHEKVQVQLAGETASLIGDSAVEAAVFGGGRGTWKLRLTTKLVKTDGNWKFMSVIASMY